MTNWSTCIVVRCFFHCDHGVKYIYEMILVRWQTHPRLGATCSCEIIIICKPRISRLALDGAYTELTHHDMHSQVERNDCPRLDRKSQRKSEVAIYASVTPLTLPPR